MKFKFVVLLLVAVTAVKGQKQDFIDYDESLWSNEASDDQLEFDKPEENNSNAVDEQFYDDTFEHPLDNEEYENQLKNIEEKDTWIENSDLSDQDNEERGEIDLKEQLHDTNNQQDTQFFDTVDSFTSEEVQKQLDEADVEANETAESMEGQAGFEQILRLHDSSIETIDNPASKIDNLDDYQIEDNRSQGKEVNKAEINDNYDNFDPIGEPKDQNTDVEADLIDIIGLYDPNLLETVDKPKLQNENLDQLSEETKQLLEEENSPSEEDFENVHESVIAVPENINESELALENDDMKSDDEKNQFFSDVLENQQNEEIRDFIDENKSMFNKNEENAQKEENVAGLDESFKYEHDMIVPEENIAFDSPDNDANSQFKELASELDDDDNSDEDTVDKVYEDLNADLAKLFETMDKFNDNSDDSVEGVVDKYEEQYNKPYGEDTILSQRQDYDNYGDLNDGSNLADIFDTSDLAEDTEEVGKNIEKQIFDLVIPESVDQPNPETGLKNTDETQPRTTVKGIDVEDLKPAQYNDLMVQFAATHVEDIDSLREDFGKSIAAVHITITDTEVTEITSPNYPNTYPTNNVIDWILEGEGTGIELNVTDLELRGVQDDFLLIKPGGADDTGHDGLVFSYHLNEPRLYRFTDVSKVFVRFQSGTGLGFLKGFRMTVKMIWPPETQDLGEVPPTPAPLLPAPPSVFTVTLGGVGQKEFFAIKDEFQRLVADMATMYIFANDIEAGDNTTHEVTQLTSIAYCNVNWPNYEQCVEVTFGVPLVYGDEAPTRLNGSDLRNMWETFSLQDPFAVRLRQMGITEFAVPDDGKVLMLWLVLASGVILSAALLAFALWRYSCIEDYTRMKSFSDTDSLREVKRGLDLYPTPHQTLPPLYADSDYKWADEKYDNTSRVDMGGFTNSSFARDELVDIDSEEEVVSPRDRNNTSFTPRDMYPV